jgi:large subunit ribosomal protein L14e
LSHRRGHRPQPGKQPLCAAPSLILPQAVVDGPTTSVPRQSYPYRHLSLTPPRPTKLPRGAGSGAIRKQLEKEGTIAKWENSAWAKQRAAIQKRRSLNDFARFEVMLAKKTRSDVVRKALAKARRA